MHKKVFKILAVVFISVALLMGVIAFILNATLGNNHRRIARDSYQVTAMIVDITSIGNSPRVYLQYEVGGREITAYQNWSSSSMFVGQPMDILVSRQNPHEFVNAFPYYRIPVWILAGLTAIFGIIGAVFFIVDKRKIRKQEQLFEYGDAIWAKVEGTESNWAIQVNGRPATVLVATHGHMRFTSDPLDNNDLMAVGEHVKVIIDPENANRYVFDIHNASFIMPKEQPKAERLN